jgi:hypothetical protein
MLDGLMIRCAFRSFPLSGTGTLSWVAASAEGDSNRLGKKKNARC